MGPGLPPSLEKDDRQEARHGYDEQDRRDGMLFQDQGYDGQGERCDRGQL